MVVGIAKKLTKTLIVKPMVCSAVVIGKDFLQYLESITTNNIYPAGTGIETLAHAEGARWVVAVIKARCEKGRKQDA